MVLIHSCTDGTSAWQYEHQWARKSIALALPFFSSAIISEFSFGPENVGAGRPIATLSSFSPAYVGKTSPVTLVSPSGRPAVKGSELNVTRQPGLLLKALQPRLRNFYSMCSLLA